MIAVWLARLGRCRSMQLYATLVTPSSNHLIETLCGVEGGVLDLGVGLEPVDALAVLGPEAVRVVDRALVHRLVFGRVRHRRASPIRRERHKPCRTWGSSRASARARVPPARITRKSDYAPTRESDKPGRGDALRRQGRVASETAQLADDFPFGFGHRLHRQTGIGHQRHLGQSLVGLDLFERDRMGQGADGADIDHAELAGRVARIG